MGESIWTVKNFQGNRIMERNINDESDRLKDIPDEILINDTSQDEPKAYRISDIRWHHHPEYPYASPKDSLTGVNFGAGRESSNQYLRSGDHPSENPFQHILNHLIETWEEANQSGHMFGGRHHSYQLFLGESKDLPEELDEGIVERRRENATRKNESDSYAALLENTDEMSEYESKLVDQALNSEDSILKTTDVDQAARISNAFYRNEDNREERYSLLCGPEAERQNHFTENYDLRITIQEESNQIQIDQISSNNGLFGNIL